MIQEGQNELGIILCKTFFLEFLDDLESTERCAVGSGSGHGIVDICDTNDRSEVINLVILQTSGITGTIETLMVLNGCIAEITGCASSF